MKDGEKTKAQLLEELAHLRQRIGELDALEAERKQMEESLRKTHDELAEHQRSEGAAEQQTRELTRSNAFTTMLSEVSAHIGTSLDSRRIMETLGAELKKLGLDCLIATLDSDAQTAIIQYDSLDSKALALGEKLTGFKLREYQIPREYWGSYASEFFEQGRPLFASRLIETAATMMGHISRPLLESALKLVGVSADDPIAYLPLMAQEQSFGILAVWGSDLEEEDISILSVFAGQVAATLENARLYEAEQQWALELTRSNAFIASLSRVGARLQSLPEPKQVFETLGAEIKELGLDCVIGMLGSDGMLTMPYISIKPGLVALGEKILGVTMSGYSIRRDMLPPTLLEQRQPLVQAGPATLMAAAMPQMPKKAIEQVMKMAGIALDAIIIYLPLVVENQILGFIGVWGEGLTEEDAPALSIFAGQVAVAMENARLYAAERERGEELARTGEHLKASLQEKEVLLKEIHHRVKNNLQVISSLLSLQSAKVEDEQVLEMFAESRDRVRSMALVHEKLYQSSDLAQVDFGEYVHSLVAQLTRTYHQTGDGAVALQVDAQDVALSIDMAVPCGLIINELVSNALKHAFPDGRNGKIRISLRAKRDGFALEVTDNGVGFPDDKDFLNSESLGMQLVALLVEQIQGRIELDRRKGTTFRITF
jgi:two-component sensor histidine kinase